MLRKYNSIFRSSYDIYMHLDESIWWFFTWMGDRSSISISADSPLDETLNQGPLALLLQRQYEFPFRINIVKFSFFFIF